MTVFDHAQMFQSSGNLTTSGYSTNAVKIYGTPVNGLGARISIPSTPGATWKILPSLYVSEDDSTYVLHSSYPGGAQSWANGNQSDLILSFATVQKYAKLYFTVTTGTTSATGFGAVQAGIVPNVGFDWDRSIGFGS